MPNALSALAGNGILGAVLVVSWVALAYWIVKLQTALETAQAKRVEDAQATADRVLKVAEEHAGADRESAAAVQSVGSALSAMQQDMRDVRDYVRSRRGGGP